MKQTVIIGILLGILLLTGCDNNEKEHDFVGIFTTANGIKFELRPDSTSIITFKDSMIYESSWKISKDRNNETYANIEFAGYQNYYYLRHYKIFCVNGNTGFRNESRIFYFIHLQNEEDYERKESSSAR